ncbi:Beta-barrel assembly-enhancing protease [Defluviimonas aquaemixtae]|uniref:Beta-barrel assembly-enhancing protease n=1 Tax=Albidovulum aquaemixtae TaxID=1542388 RepID=A0A2R8BKN7_9RHOB|nr:tetratricopeptide repeat-containing sulfotransferase family protein [Defluviimonas aquaemixtae]SPH23850.1 Beta-barrel assembly-enhancing protease [Defluviimonas aquaemixtae]
MTTVMTPNQVQQTYAEALKLHQAGKLEEALQIYGRIIEANPKIAEAHFQAGRIFTTSNRFERAFQHFQAAVKLRPAESAIWMAWAEAVALGGNADVEAAFLRTLKPAPVAADTKIVLQDRFGARRASTRPATGGAKPAQIRGLMGLMEAGRHDEAERAALAVLKQQPQSALALNVLATAQVNLGKDRAAETSFRRAIQADPNYAEAYDNLGRFLIERKRDAEAVQLFRRAVTLAPGLPSAIVNLASSYTQSGHYEAARTLLNKAEAAGVDALPFHIAAGNLYTRLKNFAKAEQAFQKAIDTAGGGKSGHATALLAQSQARLGKDDAAMANYDLALQIDPDSPVATGGKAQLLQTLGHFNQAEELFRRGFELDPLNGENFRAFIMSHKTKSDDPVIATMLDRYENPALKDADRVNMGFAIAKALEDVQDYARVFRYLDEANALMRKMSPYSIELRREQVAETKAVLDGIDWHGTKLEGTTDFAPIFVTGMPRSGTTLIEQIIASHSTVTGAGEIGECARAAQLLISDDVSARKMHPPKMEDVAELGHRFEEYIGARFPGADRITDKSIQTYMYMGLVKLAMPNARFVVVRRDPRDNLLSIYKNKFPDDTHLYAYDQKDLAAFYGTFVDVIDFWRERVPDWFYEVQYEELVANPEDETRKLIAACGLEWEDACLSFHETKRKVETLSVYQVRQPISKASVALWQRYEKELEPMLDALREGGHVPD